MIVQIDFIVNELLVNLKLNKSKEGDLYEIQQNVSLVICHNYIITNI